MQADGLTPVPNLNVYALGPRNEKTVTNENGEYRIDNLPIGKYKISAFYSDFSDGNVADDKLTFNGEVNRVDIVFNGRAKQVSGIVLDDDGVTPLGAKVALSELQVLTGLLKPDENPQCLPNIQVGDVTIELPKCEKVGLRFQLARRTCLLNNDVSSGAFLFSDFLVGQFMVEAANPFSPNTIAASGVIEEPNGSTVVTLTLQATGVITGVVFQPDGVTPVGRDVVVEFDSSTLSNVRVVTDDEGRYSYPLVNPGNFVLTAEDPSTGLVGQARGTLKAGQTVVTPIQLLRKGTVFVYVSGSGGVVSGAQVTLGQGAFPFGQRTGVSGADGRITFGGGDAVDEGRFSVSAYNAANGVRGYNSGVMPDVEISASGQVTVEVVLPDQAGGIEGRFVRSNGVTAIPNAQVALKSGAAKLM